jgi:hypothetical protein
MSGMSGGLFLGTLTTLLFAGPFLSVSWAQDKAEPPTPAPPFLSGAEITSQFNYYCPSNTACSFVCSGGASGGGQLGADHVTKLTVYLGTMPLGNDQNAPALFYDFSTRERPNSISAGLSTLSCQVNGLTLNYVGRSPSFARNAVIIRESGCDQLGKATSEAPTISVPHQKPTPWP